MQFVKNILKTVRQECKNILHDIRTIPTVQLNKNEGKILREIQKIGFKIIPNFYSENECVELKNEINFLLEKYKDQVVIDDDNSDHRIWGADRVSPLISKFFTNPTVEKIVKAHEKTNDIVGFTLAARLDYKPHNLGSGGGWHRDTAHSKQIKAILYLSDVDLASGPFQFIHSSHRPLQVIKDVFTGNFDFNQNRFTDTEIEKLLVKNKSEVKTLLGKTGTLILVNTRGLHRGMPIEKGMRYALTNYYWTNGAIPNHLKKLMIEK